MTSNYYVLRGGSWHFISDGCRSADRRRGTLDGRYVYLGFRVLRSSEVDNKFQVLRGGSWYNSSGSCRSADRNRNRHDYLGFRVIKDTDV
jgi:formylglycine-generating enzyme required for sulfatase activity